MTTTQIYRGIEDIVTAEASGDPLIEEVIKHLNEFDFRKEIYFMNSVYSKLVSKNFMLKQSQILQISKYLKELPANWAKSYYLSQLIQTSYDSGNDDFIIDDDKDTHLASRLTGKGKRKLNIKVLSSTREGLGSHSKFCNMTIEGNSFRAGENSDNCFVEIKGELNDLSLENSYHSIYKIHGDVKNIRANESSCFNIVKLNSEMYDYWKNKLTEKNCVIKRLEK